MKVERAKIRWKSHYIIASILIALVTATALYLRGDNNGGILQQHHNKLPLTTHDHEYEEESSTGVAGNETAANEDSRCNLYSGKWVFDNVSYPLYKEEECSFLRTDYGEKEHACLHNGRKEFKYQNWKWQPHHCHLPRFNGTLFLENIRGKRLVFVGDSLNRNQWLSLLCLVESSLHQSDKSIVRKDNLFIFTAYEYNATIEFYWSPLLVESNCDDPYDHSIKDRIIRIKAIEKHARHWNDADILIFDAYLWWLQPSMTLLWGSFESSDSIYKKVEMRLRRYEIVLNTWSDWVEININRTRTQLFFMSASPFHTHGQSWDIIQHCYNETEPIEKEGYWGISADREIMDVTGSVIRNLETRGVKVEYLNITHLSDYRKDAHPSIYKKFPYPPTAEQLANLKAYADCFHWCLPGVPDVWNQILYSYIVK